MSLGDHHAHAIEGSGIDLEGWAEEANAWLMANATPRPPKGALVWGRGSDDVALFRNLSEAEEQAHIDALRQWQRKKSDAGYGSIAWPKEYGGAGLSQAHERLFARLESRFLTPTGHEAVGITLDLVAPTILILGSEDQRARFLAPMRRTDEMWCQMFSEPGAGSDLASLTTRAVRDDDEWVLTGQKVWTSGAQFADFGYVLCRTGSIDDGHRGLTAFLIPMRAPGVTVRPLRQMSGGSSFNEVFLDGVRVPDSARLGAIGEGWKAALTTLGFERAAATKSGSSGGELFDRLVLLARQVGRADDPVIRQRLAQVYAEGRVRSLTRQRVSTALRSGAVPGPEGSIGKLAWTEGLRRIADLAGELLGPALVAKTGEWGTYAWSEFVNGVPGFRIAGGSDEIQRNIIAEKVLGLPRDPRPKSP